MIYRALIVVTASSIASTNETLPLYDDIPKLLCYTSRVLQKCFSQCVNHLINKCPNKFYKFNKSPARYSANNEESDVSLPPNNDTVERTRISESLTDVLSHLATVVQRTLLRRLAELPNSSVTQIPFNISSRLVPLGAIQASPTSSQGSVRLTPHYSMTTVTVTDLLSACGTPFTHPPCFPCFSRKVVDDMFRSCCQQHTRSNCHNIYTYEHRERVAVEILSGAVQQDHCDLKLVTNIFRCANRNEITVTSAAILDWLIWMWAADVFVFATSVSRATV